MPPTPGDSNGDDTAPPVGDTDAPDGDGTLAPPAGMDTDGSQGNGNSASQPNGNSGSQGMLPQTGEESTMAYTAVGMMLMALGSAGFMYFRRRQQLQR
ncbi:LPXTG cell wall anchor domain-containing protein [Paenibacillus sp. OVF10]|nr:LPXTG cell wall anchor domain-containing protein [Paenibacillus sp. OVF10]